MAMPDEAGYYGNTYAMKLTNSYCRVNIGSTGAHSPPWTIDFNL
jgi:hypothetical protein